MSKHKKAKKHIQNEQHKKNTIEISNDEIISLKAELNNLKEDLNKLKANQSVII